MVALVALAGGAGFAGGQLADGDPEGAITIPSAQRQGSVVPSGPVDAGAEEPVAAVADAVRPSVVQIETTGGLGSGVVYDAAGLILTAAHVVDGSTSVRVRLADGRTLDGTVVGTDGATDVAVVEVEGDDLPVATLGTGADVRVGQLAVAIGSPFGLDQTVTSGVVSAVGRAVETPDGAIPMIQTDAPINPGNSGGVLADRQGRVIGINDQIATRTGENTGVGFAIPIDTAVAVAAQLVAGESPSPAFLGVEVAESSGGDGVLVVSVQAGSPADDAGLEVRDVIATIDEVAMTDPLDVIAAVRGQQPGDEITVGLADGSEVTVTLGRAEG